MITTNVRESAQFIAENAEDVKIDREGCKRAAELIHQAMEKSQYSTSTWSSHELHPKSKDVSTLNWIFTVDLLNFSFWSDLDVKDTGRAADSARYAVEYKGGKLWTGYRSLLAAINRALDQGIPITSPAFWTDLDRCSDSFLADKVFAPSEPEKREPMPLLQERIECLREAGRVLVEKYQGSFERFLETANGSAVMLVNNLAKDFASFRDVCEFKGRKVYIMKRAQILASEIWACFNGESYGKFYDIDEITMFADYRVPQILCQLGCVYYSDNLNKCLKNTDKLLQHGESMEIELRGCSIWSVELIRNMIIEAHPKSHHINSVLIDFYLWDAAKEIQHQRAQQGIISQVPCHRTRSIYY